MAQHVGAANNENWKAVASAYYANTGNKRTTKNCRDMYVSVYRLWVGRRRWLEKVFKSVTTR